MLQGMGKQNKKGKKPSQVWFQVKFQPQPYLVGIYADYSAPQSLSFLKARNLCLWVPLSTGVGPLMGVGGRWQKGAGSCVPGVQGRKSPMQAIHSTAHRHSGMGSQCPEKGPKGISLGGNSIHLHMAGHLMSLRITEVKNYSLFSIKNRGLWAIKLFRFIMSSPS